MISYLKLFLIFVKIGAILLGGGYVILPIMYSEFSEKRNLVSKDDITDYFALSQSLPGIVAANISVFVGYKLKGFWGAILAVIGVIFVPFWTIILLASLIGRFVNSSLVFSALCGVGIAVIALITLTIREVWRNSKKDLYYYLILILSLIALLYFKLSPINVIILISLIGLAIKSIRRKYSDIS